MCISACVCASYVFIVFSACLFCSILVGLFASLFSNKREKIGMGLRWEGIWEEMRKGKP